MKICQRHWDALRMAIHERGLSHLVAQSPEALNELLGDGGYDPLFACNIMILMRALDIGGEYLLDGEYCPVCEALRHTAGDETVTPAAVESAWIDGPADVVLSYCREHGFVTRVTH